MRERVFFRLVMATTLILLMAIALFAITGRHAYRWAMDDATGKTLEAVKQELQKLDPTTANAADLVSQGGRFFGSIRSAIRPSGAISWDCIRRSKVLLSALGAGEV